MKHRMLEYLLSQPLMVEASAREAAVALAAREPIPGALPGMVAARKGTPVDGAEAGMVRRGPTAVIPVVGPITRYADFFTELCGGVTVENVARDLRAALDDPAVRSIVLEVDSPGGEAAGVGELAGQIRAANAAKPVVAYVGSQAASAGYYLACAAGEVVCAEGALLGSIGVVIGFTARADRPGQTSYEFVSSDSPAKRPDPATESGKAEYQRLVDDLAAVFIADVARYRGVAAETVVADFGRGGQLVGRKAVAAGMADRIGTFESVLSDLALRPARVTSTPTAEAGEHPVALSLWRKKNGALAVQSAATEEGDAPASDDILAAIRAYPARPAEPTAAAPAAAATETAAENERLRAALATAHADTIKAKAEGWYGTLFASNKIVPAERDGALGAYIQAAADDLTSPVAGGKTRVALVEGIYSARTPHTLCVEQTADAGAVTVDPATLPAGHRVAAPNAATAAAPTKDRINALVGHLVAAGMVGPDALAK